jgi:hypothetical protein
MLYYRPSAEKAFESVEFIMTTVPFGWLIRSIHSWSANLMVFFAAFVHLATVYFAKAYRPPRELTWITGCLLLFLTLAFGFSGYLLPWNQLAFFATKVGTEIAGVGAGGGGVDGALPARRRPGERRNAVALLRLARGHPAGPHRGAPRAPPAPGPAPRHERAAGADGRGRPAPADALLPALRAARPVRLAPRPGVLAALAAFFPWELGRRPTRSPRPTPTSSPSGTSCSCSKPSSKYRAARSPASSTRRSRSCCSGSAGWSCCWCPSWIVGSIARAGARRSPPRVGSLIYMVALTAWGYRSWVPVWAVLATLALIGVFAFVVRHEGGEEEP